MVTLPRSALRALAAPTFLALAVGCASSRPQPKLATIENGLRPPVLVEGDATWSIDERMQQYKVPGLSIAVFADGKILWAKGYGVAASDAQEPVTPETSFEAGALPGTTPSELARFALGVQAEVRDHKELDAPGLAIDGAYFTGGGAAEGSCALLYAHATKGYGIAMMANSDAGSGLLHEVARSVGAAYHWEDFAQAPARIAKVDPAQLLACAGRYRLDAGSALTVSVRGARLEGRPTLGEPFELLPVSANTFVRRDEETRYVFAPEGLRREGSGAGSDAPRLAQGERLLDEQLAAGSLDAALAGYRALHEASAEDPVVAPARLEALAHALVARNDFPAALALLQLETELRPDSTSALELYRRTLDQAARLTRPN